MLRAIVISTGLRGAASLHVTGSKGPTPGVKGCKKLPPYTPLVGLMDPYTSEERGFFKCYRVQRTHVWRIRG